jgi:hypothetical protein
MMFRKHRSLSDLHTCTTTTYFIKAEATTVSLGKAHITSLLAFLSTNALRVQAISTYVALAHSLPQHWLHILAQHYRVGAIVNLLTKEIVLGRT